MNKKLKTSLAANRQYKDSVFSLLFSNKRILIQLVNAIFGTNYDPNTKIKISTIRKVLSNCRMNDLSFIIDNRLIILIEHQSTINENMPYRMLQILPEHYKRLHNIKDEYRSQMMTIQKPKFIVLYNGTEEMPEDKRVLRLSDMFAKPMPGDMVDDGQMDLELTVTMYNINDGHNADIKNRCAALREYSIFISMIHEYRKTMSVEAAIQKAVVDCIDQNVLKTFLSKRKKEVVNMLVADFDMDVAKEVWLEEGMTLGQKKMALKIARNMVEMGDKAKDIVERTGLSIDTVLKLQSDAI